MALIATKRQRYAGRGYDRGDEIPVRKPGDAKVLIAVGLARHEPDAGDAATRPLTAKALAAHRPAPARIMTPSPAIVAAAPPRDAAVVNADQTAALTAEEAAPLTAPKRKRAYQTRRLKAEG